MRSVRKTGDGRETTQCGEIGLEKGLSSENERGYLVRIGVLLSPEDFLEATESRETGF